MQRYPDLPVSVDLPDPLAREVSAFVEAEAGWQVVGEGGPLVPVLAVGTTVTPGGRSVVITDGSADADQVRRDLLAGAVDVIAWPAERSRLLQAPERLARAAAPAPVPPLRIAGCRGGVGTSTVALAVGATVAWAGGRALVVGDDDLLRLAGAEAWEGAGARELMALGEQAAVEVGGVARPVPGVPGLAVLRGEDDVDSVAGWPFDVVVSDAGTAGRDRARLVVGAADAAVSNAPAAVATVIVEHGPLDRSGVRRAVPGPVAGWLPYSARVARAGAAGRVPSALPGSWVAALRRALERVG